MQMMRTVWKLKMTSDKKSILTGKRVIYARGAKGPLIGYYGIIAEEPDQDGIVMVNFDNGRSSPCWIGNLEELVEDPRKTGLKNGLRQLSEEQLQKVIDYPHEMVLDEVNYDAETGRFCPLAVALDLPQTMKAPTHQLVFDTLTALGYNVYNTRGIKGEFYTTNRKEDLITAAKEVLAEKRNEGNQ